jgi:hypothetical protein
MQIIQFYHRILGGQLSPDYPIEETFLKNADTTPKSKIELPFIFFQY